MMRTVRTRALLAGGAVMAAVAAAAPASYASLQDRPAERGTAYVETRLFFGTAKPDGGPAVTDRQFMGFVDREVTPGFPEGLTVQQGRGQWRDRNGVIERERSYVLVLLYPQEQAAARDALIEEIRTDYRTAYGQEAVGRADDALTVDF
ncbi:DUF3574 domain-containing protein [Streptomyces bambusae]|uniref:DUF3574 domain-containing protein n=1 Tax=Streptomyces bambusae TaxID=1550616 RepID=UPI001CFCA04B|nr:DUF3574 domain-containing protein [Streptomyces bambusae]MCB5165988.1 DUF3574 domain-containing protein [Streptomyces bambusae]